MTNKTATERVKTMLSILAIFLMGVIAGYVALDGAAKEQAQRELVALDKIERAKVGQHIRVNGVGLLKTSHHAGRVSE